MPGIPASEVFKEFTPAQQARIKKRARELIEEERTLRDMRRARRMTQTRMAKLLKVKQENVSRLERRADLLLSTLSSYVKAMGGTLRLLAEFPNRRPVAIALGDIGSDAPPPKPRGRRRK
jgi:hypothetical protein